MATRLSRASPQLQTTQLSQVSTHRYGRVPGTRSFHIAPVVLAATQAAQDAILSIHSFTYTPWFLTIPLIAVGVNVVGRLPFNAYIHSIQYRRLKFNIVLQGWMGRIGRDTQKEGIPRNLREKEMKTRYKRVVKRIYRSMGLQGWKLYANILGFPFWILGIDTVRRLCGGPRGIIGALLTGYNSDAAAAAAASSTQASTEATASTSTAEISTTAASHASAVDISTVSTVAEHAQNLPDPSIALEGCLWFPDLSAADPYHILPAALSAMLVFNILPRTSAARRELFGLKPEGEPTDRSQSETSQAKMSPWQNRLHRVLILVAISVGPITASLPAALHLYWLTTATTHWATGKVLTHFMPLNAKSYKRCIGVENSIIKPKRSGKAALQSEQQHS
ncbi:hypothetical protein AAE478_005259 [Parahypoxylon ruwenzoriense]